MNAASASRSARKAAQRAKEDSHRARHQPARHRSTPRQMVLQWGSLALAVVFLVVFLLVQSQTATVRYGTESVPAASLNDREPKPTPNLPGIGEIETLREDGPVVRLPGAIAGFDADAVAELLASGDGEDRDGDPLELGVLVAPPGTGYEQRSELREMDGLPVQIWGYDVTSRDANSYVWVLLDWQNILAGRDVTTQVLEVLSQLTGREIPEKQVRVPWRAPTAAELATVTASLDATGTYFAPGSGVTELPASAAAAFPAGSTAGPSAGDAGAATDAKIVVLPQPEHGVPVPQYGPALAALYPDTPVLVQYGYWFDYHGPGEADQDLVKAAFYAATPSDFAEGGFAQSAVLANFLKRWAEFGYSGMFDRPLPYTPPDPVRVAWPVLPWIFLAGVLVFVVISVRVAVGARPVPIDHRDRRHRLAGLSSLAVELSGLIGTDRRADFVRATVALDSARSGIESGLPVDRIDPLLATADEALDEVARHLDRPEYRPGTYLRQWAGA